MQKNWYIVALILMLTLFGVVREQQVALPNQEIVLKFTETTISSEDIQEAFSSIKWQLQALGAENIQMKQHESGLLKISYYSDTDVSQIREILNSSSHVELENSPNLPAGKSHQIPVEDHDFAYQLDIHELNKTFDSDWDFDGNLATLSEIKGHRLLLIKIDLMVAWIISEAIQKDVNTSYKLYQELARSLGDEPGLIPETRAGPAFC